MKPVTHKNTLPKYRNCRTLCTYVKEGYSVLLLEETLVYLAPSSLFFKKTISESNERTNEI